MSSVEESNTENCGSFLVSDDVIERIRSEGKRLADQAEEMHVRLETGRADQAAVLAAALREALRNHLGLVAGVLDAVQREAARC